MWDSGGPRKRAEPANLAGGIAAPVEAFLDERVLVELNRHGKHPSGNHLSSLGISLTVAAHALGATAEGSMFAV
ncbi:MAG TPA: hypothetical protein VKA45_03920 [Gaiellaceae bacterium]|nr:hypothetical protein [Gaiellaceae bacterium]